MARSTRREKDLEQAARSMGMVTDEMLREPEKHFKEAPPSPLAKALDKAGFKDVMPPVDIAKSSAGLLVQVNTLQVKDRASADQAGGLLQGLKTLIEGIEAKRTGLVKPLNDHVKTINAEFKRHLDPLRAADAQLRGKVVAWKQEEQVRADQARLEAERVAREMEEKRERAAKLKGKAKEKATAELVEAENEAVQATQRFLDAAPQAVTGVSGVDRWTFEVTDMEAVPRAYLEVDGAKVRAAIREGKREISGLRIFQKPGIAVGKG